jgi:hypothetical protein
MTSSAPSVFPFENSIPARTRIVHTLADFGVISSARPVNLSR